MDYIVILGRPLLVGIFQRGPDSLNLLPGNTFALPFDLCRSNPPVRQFGQFGPAAIELEVQSDRDDTVVIELNDAVHSGFADNDANTRLVHNRRICEPHIIWRRSPKLRPTFKPCSTEFTPCAIESDTLRNVI